MGSAGIDYGRGLTNIDQETGIRYEVINQGEVLQAWADSSEAQYPEVSCPDCGWPVVDAREDFDYTAECGVYSCINGHVWYPIEIETEENEETLCPECGEIVTLAKDWHVSEYAHYFSLLCPHCHYVISEEDSMSDEPNSFTYDGDGYQCQRSADDMDIFIIKSPYFTYCKFCF